MNFCSKGIVKGLVVLGSRYSQGLQLGHNSLEVVMDLVEGRLMAGGSLLDVIPKLHVAFAPSVHNLALIPLDM